MKKHYTAPFMRIILMFAVLFSAQAAFGQILWDGGGDGTSWNDAANWAGDVVPPADSLVAFEMDAVVTGTVSAAHARINVRNRAVVTFNLNINIGNGVTSEHSLVVGTGSTLNIAAGRTVTLQPSTDKQALPIFATADTAVIHIAAGATLRILQGNNGINIVNVNSTLVNDGVILMSSAVKNGIKSAGTFINNGIVSLDHLSTDGIIVGAYLKITVRSPFPNPWTTA
ncbi:MAG TPA: hypothetical protein PLL53_03750 [Saprospiraceae bacterium]|nr:hypothetical protein [Saprospiraceae bacterium]